jgi:hypothetical protein
MPDTLAKILVGFTALGVTVATIGMAIPALVNSRTDAGLFGAFGVACGLIGFLYFTAKQLGILDEKESEDE